MATPSGLTKIEAPKGVKNIDFYTDGNDGLWLRVDTKKRLGPSKSGKTTIVGTSSGNKDVNGVTCGLNFYV
jgi:hypothetical protein